MTGVARTNIVYGSKCGWKSGAEFSPCGQWRYGLWRRWVHGGRCNMVAFVGLNPSTADESVDDPTVRRCIQFAKDWGYHGMYMLNAYAFRATDPKDMQAAADPVGPDNDEKLWYYTRFVTLIVVAWGVHCDDERELQVLRTLNRPVMCLGTTKGGKPKHPLYLARSTKPQLFNEGLVP